MCVCVCVCVSVCLSVCLSVCFSNMQLTKVQVHKFSLPSRYESSRMRTTDFLIGCPASLFSGYSLPLKNGSCFLKYFRVFVNCSPSIHDTASSFPYSLHALYETRTVTSRQKLSWRVSACEYQPSWHKRLALGAR